jgi:hypothetical protein
MDKPKKICPEGKELYEPTNRCRKIKIKEPSKPRGRPKKVNVESNKELRQKELEQIQKSASLFSKDITLPKTNDDILQGIININEKKINRKIKKKRQGELEQIQKSASLFSKDITLPKTNDNILQGIININQNKKEKEMRKKREDELIQIKRSASLFSKDPFMPKLNDDIIEGIININKKKKDDKNKMKQVFKTMSELKKDKPKIKRTNKRNLIDIEIMNEQKIREDKIKKGIEIFNKLKNKSIMSPSIISAPSAPPPLETPNPIMSNPPQIKKRKSLKAKP